MLQMIEHIQQVGPGDDAGVPKIITRAIKAVMENRGISVNDEYAEDVIDVIDRIATTVVDNHDSIEK